MNTNPYNVPPYTITYNNTTNPNYGITPPNYGITPNTLTFSKPINSGLSVEGDAKIAGDLIIGNTKFSDRLDKIEEILGIAITNKELENRWTELAELGRKYRALERELIEKEKIWNTLKGEK